MIPPKVRCWGKTHVVREEQGEKGATSEREGRAWGMQLVTLKGMRVKTPDETSVFIPLLVLPFSLTRLSAALAYSEQVSGGPLLVCCPRQVHLLCLGLALLCVKGHIQASRGAPVLKKYVNAMEPWPPTSSSYSSSSPYCTFLGNFTSCNVPGCR